MQLLMIIMGAVALLLLALILFSGKGKGRKVQPTSRRGVARERQGVGLLQEKGADLPEELRRRQAGGLFSQSRKPVAPLIDPIQQAPEGAAPCWMVWDFQTTGLSTEEGREARILEATWLLLDAEYRLIARHTHRVRQSEKSTPEALAIHGITDTLHAPFSISEEELAGRLLADLRQGEGITIVSHNVQYDLAILCGMLKRVAPEAVVWVSDRPTLCTMTYLGGYEGKAAEASYPSLLHLTQQLKGVWPATFLSVRPVSWRNSYFTRLCLIELLAAEKPPTL